MGGIQESYRFNDKYKDRIEIIDSEKKGQFEGKVENEGGLGGRQVRTIDGCVRITSVSKKSRTNALEHWTAERKSNNIKKWFCFTLGVPFILPIFLGIFKFRRAQKNAEKEILSWSDHIDDHVSMRKQAENGFRTMVDQKLVGKFVTRKEAAAAWRKEAKSAYAAGTMATPSRKTLDDFFSSYNILHPESYTKKPKKESTSRKFDPIEEKYITAQQKYEKLKETLVYPIEREISDRTTLLEKSRDNQLALVEEEYDLACKQANLQYETDRAANPETEPTGLLDVLLDDDVERKYKLAKRLAENLYDQKTEKNNTDFEKNVKNQTSDLQLNKKTEEAKVIASIKDDVSEIVGDMQKALEITLS